MKKASILGLACALFLGAQTVSAQETAQEVTYQPDPSQGLLINRMQDNWFITVEGGADVYAAKYWGARKFSDRFMPAAGIYVGKWFTPVFGARAGVNYLGLKGVATGPDYFGVLPGEKVNGYYKTKSNEVGPQFDLMVNLTNWWCGYNPDRIYNASFYVGAGTYFSFTKDAAGDWGYRDNILLDLRAGILQNFRISKQMQLGLDLRWSGVSCTQNYGGKGFNQKYMPLQA
ncbi:MAG: hypothetical protein K2F79_05425, partial [Muribaculaceae bacterium]|nr:hypothetical protein [Muribaculaceae bacterium]